MGPGQAPRLTFAPNAASVLTLDAAQSHWINDRTYVAVYAVAAATHAAKLTREEAVLDFSQPAAVCHNKVRAFVPWPGTFATFAMVDPSSSSSSGDSESSSSSGETVELKIVRTRVGQPSSWQGGSERQVAATKDALLIRCADGSVLEVRAALGWLMLGVG